MSARRLLCWAFVMVVGVLVFASAPALAVAPEVTIEGESSANVNATEARLEAIVNPGGSEASYHFEYGPAAGSYDVSVPSTDLKIPAGEVGVSVNVVLTGLNPGTTYHYRVVASNALPGSVDGVDQSFTTPAAQGSGSPAVCPNEQLRAEQPYALELPDCRAYEMVSPVNTEGQDATDSTVVLSGSRASVSGDAVTYASRGDFAGPTGANSEDQFLSRRGPEGWSTQAITPLQHAMSGEPIAPYMDTAFTPELTEGIATSNASLAPGGAEGFENAFSLYLADFANDSYQSVGGGVNPEGTSADLSHVVSGGQEWVNGEVVPVTVSNSGEQLGASIGGPYVWRAVSADGSRVYFTSGDELYLRENAEQPQSPMSGEACTDPSDACTVEVSASQKTDGSGPRGTDLNEGSVSYAGASTDGSRVFFTGNEELTNNANTGASDRQEVVLENASGGTYTITFKGQTTAPVPYDATSGELQSALEGLSSIGAGNVTVSAGGYVVTFDGALAGSEQPAMTANGSSLTVGGTVSVKVLERPGNDLYEYDLESGKLQDLTVDTANTDGAEVQGVAQISEDGSYVYFVASGDLAMGATAGSPNLYVSHDDGAPTFIATLAANDRTDWLDNGPLNNTTVVTPSGSRLAFVSELGLTGYDNEQAEPGECEGEETGKCREIYLYDAETNGLVCASCNPSGARPVGPSNLTRHRNTFADLVEYRARNLVEDGVLFFNSADALVPHASDGRENVYEYENGHVYPISDVAGGFESFFMDASPNGHDVFFGSADQLLPQDTSNNVVVYDARIEGGFPVTVSSPPCDNGDSCKPPPAPQSGVFGAPGSATFSGPGNIAPVVTVAPAVKAKSKTVKCKKGYEKKKDKCVKKAKSKKKAKKSSDRKGSK